jgi:hypothetical protein
MPEDAPTDYDPRDHEFARWLHALAEMVERNPDLAELVRRRAAPPPDPLPIFNGEGEIAHQADQPDPCDQATMSDLPAPSADGEELGPLLRHTRRASRYGPPSVSGRAPELGTGIPDPFALFAREGAEGLRRALETLRVGSLRAIIRAHNLDPQGKLPASATEKRLITAILAAVQRQQTP